MCNDILAVFHIFSTIAFFFKKKQVGACNYWGHGGWVMSVYYLIILKNTFWMHDVNYKHIASSTHF